jgi:hypothetical protein
MNFQLARMARAAFFKIALYRIFSFDPRASAAIIAFLHRDGPRVGDNNPALRRTLFKTYCQRPMNAVSERIGSTTLENSAASQPAGPRFLQTGQPRR